MLTNPKHPKVRYFSSLKTKKRRKAEGKFIVEGIHLVSEGLKCGLIDRVLFSGSIMRTYDGKNLIGKIISSGIPHEEVNEKIFKDLSNVETPQWIIASVRPKLADFGSLFEADRPLILVACGIQDPGNLGTMIRTASAAGCSGLILTQGTVDPYNEKVVRATAGTIFHLNMVKIDDIIEVVSSLKRRGIKVISSFVDASRAYFEADYCRPTAVVIGSEGQGLPAGLENISDETVSIPMAAGTESLNAGVAAAVILFEAVRQRRVQKGNREGT